MKRYVWLNIQTGKFSDSWDQETHNRCFQAGEVETFTKEHPEWKLIHYECLTDTNFEFMNLMVIK